MGATADVPLSRSGLFVDDRDGDGRWSAGEAVWRNRPLLDGEVGLGGILHFADADGDGRRGAGEPVWAETDAGAGAVSLSWNDSGCLTADGRRVYAWSADCRLQHTETATEKVEFLYDGQGRRLAKTVTRRDAPGSPVATFYVWDGWTVVEETESVRDAETGLWSETVVAEYLPGLGLDDHIVAFLHGEEVHFHQDHLGSVLMLTDADGNVLQRYRYDIHGNATVLDAAGNVLGIPSTQSEISDHKSEISPLSPYLFTGRRLDRETGLYYYRNRYYSPLLGKFISPDPLDYVDGMNVYAYVNGNVVNLVDPMGTKVLIGGKNPKEDRDLESRLESIIKGNPTLFQKMCDDKSVFSFNTIAEFEVRFFSLRISLGSKEEVLKIIQDTSVLRTVLLRTLAMSNPVDECTTKDGEILIIGKVRKQKEDDSGNQFAGTTKAHVVPNMGEDGKVSFVQRGASPVENMSVGNASGFFLLPVPINADAQSTARTFGSVENELNARKIHSWEVAYDIHSHPIGAHRPLQQNWIAGRDRIPFGEWKAHRELLLDMNEPVGISTFPSGADGGPGNYTNDMAFVSQSGRPSFIVHPRVIIVIQPRTNGPHRVIHLGDTAKILGFVEDGVKVEDLHRREMFRGMEKIREDARR